MHDFETFLNQLATFDTAMLVTRRGGALRSRPMAVAESLADGRIRFITRDDSGKLDELAADDSVNVALQGTDCFLSISGHARSSKDRQLIDAAWQRRQNPWFAKGKDDPHVIVLEVVPLYAEYWDRRKVSKLRMLLEEVRHALTDVAPASDDAIGEHGRLDFRNPAD